MDAAAAVRHPGPAVRLPGALPAHLPARPRPLAHRPRPAEAAAGAVALQGALGSPRGAARRPTSLAAGERRRPRRHLPGDQRRRPRRPRAALVRHVPPQPVRGDAGHRRRRHRHSDAERGRVGRREHGAGCRVQAGVGGRRRRVGVDGGDGRLEMDVRRPGRPVRRRRLAHLLVRRAADGECRSAAGNTRPESERRDGPSERQLSERTLELRR